MGEDFHFQWRGQENLPTGIGKRIRCGEGQCMRQITNKTNTDLKLYKFISVGTSNNPLHLIRTSSNGTSYGRKTTTQKTPKTLRPHQLAQPCNQWYHLGRDINISKTLQAVNFLRHTAIELNFKKTKHCFRGFIYFCVFFLPVLIFSLADWFCFKNRPWHGFSAATFTSSSFYAKQLEWHGKKAKPKGIQGSMGLSVLVVGTDLEWEILGFNLMFPFLKG